MKKKKTTIPRGETMVRMFAVQTVAQVLALAINTAKIAGDDDLIASLERVDALHYHEARNFLKLPLEYAQRRRRK